jgi:hypothetical protein
VTPHEFVVKWRASRLKESSAAHEHFIDLCRMLALNLERAEGERRKLRVLLETLNPELDVDAALVALDGQQEDDKEESDERGASGDGLPVMMDEDGRDEETHRERYEWEESHRPLSKDSASTLDKDGMAILPSVNAGYLGECFFYLSSGRHSPLSPQAAAPAQTCSKRSPPSSQHPFTSVHGDQAPQQHRNRERSSILLGFRRRASQTVS